MKLRKPLSIAMSAAMVMAFSPVTSAFAKSSGQDGQALLEGGALADAANGVASQAPAGEQAGQGDSLGLYNVIDKKAKTVELTQFKGDGSVAVVPESVTLNDGQTYVVASIGEKAFFDNQKVASVDIASSVRKVGTGAFEECTKLKKVAGGEGLESIGDRAFFYCTGLGGVKVPSTLASIGKGAFFGCSSLKTIDIPSSVTSIGKYAFSKCTNLAKVTGMEGIERIEPRTFRQCSSLVSVPLREGLSSIGDRAFAECQFLEVAKLPESLEELGGNAFADCGNLKEVSVDVKEIPDSAFYDCWSLKSLKLGERVEKIGTQAFGCGGSLKTVSLPESVSSIAADAFASGSLKAFKVARGNKSFSAVDGVLYNADETVLVMYPQRKADKSFAPVDTAREVADSAFESAIELKSVNLSHITKIGKNAFNLSALKSVKFSKSLSEIGEGAFQTTVIKTLSLPSSLKEIPASAFDSISSLKTVSIPEGVEKIGSGAFRDCNDLASISIPASATSISGDFAVGTSCAKYRVASGSETYKCVKGLLCSADGKTLVSCPPRYGKTKKKDGPCVVPNGIEVIGSGSFCGVYTPKVEIPASVTTLKSNAFDDSIASMKKGIAIPSTVTTIEDNAIGYANGTDDGNRVEGALIIGKRGSAAERYALANDLAFATGAPKMKIAKAKLARCGKKTTVSVKGMKTGQVKYYSSDQNVVKVDMGTGRVTAVGAGKTNVVAAMGTYYLHVNVTVGGKKATAGKDNVYSGYKSVSSKKDLKAWEKKYYAANKSRSFNAAGNPAINCYTSSEYVAIKAMQGDVKYIDRAKDQFGDDIEEYGEVSDLLKWELGRFRLPVSTQLYSGIGSVYAYTGAASTLDDMQASVGRELKHPVVVSTALFDSIADGFSSGPYATVIRVLAPKNKTVCGYLYKFSEYPSEYEVLLANDAHFKVVDCGVRYAKLHDPELKTGESKYGTYERYITLQYLGGGAE